MTSLIKHISQLCSGSKNLLNHIDELESHFQQREPEVLAFVPEAGRFDRLRRDAQTLLARYPAKHNRPPLFGLLIGVKDIFHVDGIPTHAGSKLPPKVLAGEESKAVSALKRAGGLILGKTVTTEFAYFGAGLTRNPHNPAHTPGGSSSGSAAAVAAGLCPLTFGTQTIGSVNRPAAFCGVVGYKPSYDRISKEGVIPLAPSLDHVGIFAEEVAGISFITPFLVNNWQKQKPAAKPTLGIPAGPYLQKASTEGLANFETTTSRLREAGYAIKTIPVMPDFEQIAARHILINAAETAQVHEQWFAQYSDRYHPKTVALIEEGQTISMNDLTTAIAGRLKLRADMTQIMAAAGIDLWIAPAAVGEAPKGLDSTGDPIMNLPWSHAGMPTLNVPSGKSKSNLPLSLQMIAPFNADEALIHWAAAVQGVVEQI